MRQCRDEWRCTTYIRRGQSGRLMSFLESCHPSHPTVCCSILYQMLTAMVLSIAKSVLMSTTINDPILLAFSSYGPASYRVALNHKLQIWKSIAGLRRIMLSYLGSTFMPRYQITTNLSIQTLLKFIPVSMFMHQTLNFYCLCTQSLLGSWIPPASVKVSPKSIYLTSGLFTCCYENFVRVTCLHKTSTISWSYDN